MSKLAQVDALSYYKELEEQKDEYDVLAQGPYMTAIRHAFVIKQLAGGRRVLDYGCGNGQIMEHSKFQFDGDWWVGADFMASREEPFLKRAEKCGVPAKFELVDVPEDKDYLKTLKALVAKYRPDTLILCGVLGYQGFTSIEEVKKALKRPRMRVIMTVPTITPSYKETDIDRFDANELAEFRIVEKLHDGLHGVVF